MAALLCPFADEEKKAERNKHVKRTSDRDRTPIPTVIREAVGEFLTFGCPTHFQPLGLQAGVATAEGKDIQDTAFSQPCQCRAQRCVPLSSAIPGSLGKSDMQNPNGMAFQTNLVPTIERGTALAPESRDNTI